MHRYLKQLATQDVENLGRWIPLSDYPRAAPRAGVVEHNEEVDLMKDGFKENPGLIEDGIQKRESKRLHGFSEDGRPVGDGRGSPAGRNASSSWVNWQSVLYLVVVGMMCVWLVPLTSLWWIVPLVGAVVPIALALLDKPITSRKQDDRK